MSKQIPMSVRFLLCDDVRSEASGKITIIGLYPADKVIVKAIVGAPPPKNAVAVLTQLSIVGMVVKGAGTQAVKSFLLGPSEQKLYEGTMGEISLGSDGNATLVVQYQNFLVPEYGDYIFKLLIGEEKIEYPFQIIYAPDPAATASAQATTKKKKVSKRKIIHG